MRRVEFPDLSGDEAKQEEKKEKYASNYISTTKYNLLTFLPIKRYRQDKQINSTIVKKWNKYYEEFEDSTWKDIVVGDIVYISEKEEFPADIVLLQSSGQQGLCNIQTANLDGETNLKIKRAIPATHQLDSSPDGLDYPKFFTCTIECSTPSPGMDQNSWKGTIADMEPISGSYPLTMTQLLLRGCSLKNTSWIIGMVIFTGAETKIMLNSQKARFKRSKVDLIVDRALYSIFALEIILCTLGSVLYYLWLEKNGSQHWYLDLNESSFANYAGVNVLTYIVLFDLLVPISLYVSMEMVKVVQAWFINQDLDMYDSETKSFAKARTSNLNEELGQVDYIFTDKTGTLTENQMEFLRATISGIKYGPQEMEEQKEIVEFCSTPLNFPVQTQKFRFEDNRPTWILKKNPSDPRAGMINEFLTVLSVCHSVLPDFKNKKGQRLSMVMEDSLNDIHDLKIAEIDYQAASPDERALVLAALNFQYFFFKRKSLNVDFHGISIDGQQVMVNILGAVCEFTLYLMVEFDSARKRMSVVVHDPRDNLIKLYCKGADNVIYDRLTEESKERDWNITENHINDYASSGLRTLCFAYKVLSIQEFMDWYEKYSKAAIAIEDRESLIDQCYEELEQNLTLIGCSAIEDKLQDEVPETIETLSKAGIKIWMLTGDKLETAVNIGRSCNLLSDDMFEYERLIILDIDESLDDSVAQSNILSQIQSANENINSSDEFSEEFGLVVSGKALGCILSSESSILESFIDLCINCKSVICCRISPKQKSSVVSMIKDRLKGKVTLSIGDGANDVPMIRSAHVGIGIIGKEGLQAVMASDYAISQFKFLQNLLLVHGQWSYRRISVLICYSFYKNVIASIINICFAFVSAFSGQIYYDATISSGYNLIFTSVPVLFVSVFNRDHPKNILLTYPDFYKTGQKNSFLNLKILWFGNLKAIFSSIVIFLFTYFVYNGCGPLDQTGRISSFFSMSTTSFTALFLVVTLKISLDTKTWVFLSHIGIWGSLIVWFASVAVLSNLSFYMDFNGVFEEMYQSPTNWFLILLSTVTCIIPDIIEIYFKPSESVEIDESIRASQAQKTLVRAVSQKISNYQLVRSSEDTLSPLSVARSPSVSQLKGFVPFQSDQKDKDFVMSQKEFLRMSLSSAASPLRSPRQSSQFGLSPDSSVHSLKFQEQEE